MYHYLQFRPDKKERWHLVPEDKLEKLEKPPAYVSVLRVDQDVDAIEEAGEDPFDHIRYKGPVYFDLDNEQDIDAVLDSSRELVSKLISRFGIDPDYIQCWLSGGKGVHLIIPETLFGVKRSTKLLPVVYRELAKQVAVDNLDMNVYSGGKGRLWRCANIARPGKGTFKVGVSLAELDNLDAQGYEALVAAPRPDHELVLPPENLVSPKAATCFKMAKRAADQWYKASKNAKTIPIEEIRKLEEVPGCIQKLITDGDCDESNYNQATMQVAAWVAARYDRSEEETYTAEIVEPFIEHVESASRPTVKERRKHVNEMIGRAFGGRIKFGIGALIRTLGEPCHQCPLCRGDLSFDASAQEAGADEEPYDHHNRIKASKAGYLLVSDNGARNLTSFTFWPQVEVKRLCETDDGDYRETPREAYRGRLIDDTGAVFEDVLIPEDAWSSRSILAKEVGGHGSAMLFCTDVELQRIYRSILRFSVEASDEGTESMTETPVCGIYLEKRGKVTLTHYIEHGASIMPSGSLTGSLQSRFRYSGTRSLSPSLIDEDFPYVDDEELIEALHALCNVNEPASVARVMGWSAACHLREHIHHVLPQFPLLNLWGNASAGKTMTALLFTHLNGMDYQLAEPVNMETTRVYPLKKFVSSSTTVPRLVEEVNEAGMKSRAAYVEVMGLFKAAWNRSTVQRGTPGKHGIRTEVDRVSSPILFVSEQRPNRPAVRNRTVEVMLTAAARERPGRTEAFNAAYRHRHSLHRAAKAMLQYALNLSVDDVADMIEAQEEFVPLSMDARPRWSFKVVLAGLAFMDQALKRCQVDLGDALPKLRQALIDDLKANHKQIDRDKRTSEVDRVMLSLDQMAADPTDRQNGLCPGEHYERIGQWLKLDVRRLMTRYRRYCRSVGDMAIIADPGQLEELLSGETYFDRRQHGDDNPAQVFHVIDLTKLAEKGITLNHFQETA